MHISWSQRQSSIGYGNDNKEFNVKKYVWRDIEVQIIDPIGDLIERYELTKISRWADSAGYCMHIRTLLPMNTFNSCGRMVSFLTQWLKFYA